MTICADGDRLPIETPLLFIGKKGRWGLFAAAFRALLGRTRDDDMIRLEAVEQLRVESRRSHLTMSAPRSDSPPAGSPALMSSA